MMDKSNEQQTDLYSNYWSKLEKIFKDSEELEEFFRFYLAAITYEFFSKRNLYKAFKNYWYKEEKLTSDIEILDKLLRYSKYFYELYYVEPEDKYKEILNDFRSIESLMPAPFLLGVSKWFFYDKKISEQQYYEIIKIINNYQIRRYFNGDDSGYISRAFPSYLKTVKEYSESKGFENIVNIVIYVLVTKNQSNSMACPTDNILIQNLQNANAYSMRFTHWLLEKIETYKNPAPVDMSNLSIEHIMPQKVTPYWKEKAGITKEEEYSQLVNTIGNLTLATKTDISEAGNKDFEIKKKIFEDTNHIHMNKDICAASDWTAQSIKNRSNKLINKLIEMYSYFRSQGNYVQNKNRNIFLYCNGVSANGYLNDDETVIIYAGSQIYSQVNKYTTDSLGKLREKLLEEGIIKREIDGLYFIQNYVCSSISKAASLILGGSRNGWDWWKDENGIIVNNTLRKKKIFSE